MDSPIQSYLRTLHAELSGLTDGKPYAGIPGMAGADPDKFAICLATVDGYVYEVGDSGEEFTIQSISKPFTYGLALSDLGLEAVDRKVDVEPSGNAFNEISLAPGTGRPANAMINAGALTATSLIKGSGGKTGFRRILEHYSAFAGRGALGQRAHLSVGGAARLPQPGAGPPAALLRDHRAGSGPGGGGLLPAVLGVGHLPRPVRHGRHAGQRRHQPADWQAGAGPGGGGTGPFPSWPPAACTTTPGRGSRTWGCRPSQGSAAACSRCSRASWAWPSIRRR